jgi:hypothetical protein
MAGIWSRGAAGTMTHGPSWQVVAVKGCMHHYGLLQQPGLHMLLGCTHLQPHTQITMTPLAVDSGHPSRGMQQQQQQQQQQ